MKPLPTVSDRAFAIEAVAVLVISAGIVFAADRLVFMSILVPVVFALRFVALYPIVRREWGFGLGTEALLLAGCTLVGAFNDWNSVVNHRIYDYDVPAFFPQLTTIPEWMLLFWGLILRSLITLFRWERMKPPAAVYNAVRGLGGASSKQTAWAKLVVQILLIVVTRQFIYRFYEDPILSWLPFALAIVLYAVVLEPRRYEMKLVAAFLVGGPLIEIAYIQFGSLHAYHLGWLGGVPLWIALWWVLSMLIWSDLSARVLARISSR